MNTKIDLKFEDNSLSMTITGEVTAFTEFPKLSQDHGSQLNIYLEGISYINSGGVKNWMSWIAGAHQVFKDSDLIFHRLPAIFIRQAAQIQGFLPVGAKVHSFIVPYYCYTCQKNTDVTYTFGSNWQKGYDEDEIINKLSYTSCDGCKKPAEIDAVPEHYVHLG